MSKKHKKKKIANQISSSETILEVSESASSDNSGTLQTGDLDSADFVDAGFKQPKKAKYIKVPFKKHTMPAFLRVGLTVVMFACMAIIFNWYVVWRTNLYDTEAMYNWIQQKPELYVYGAFIIFGLMAVLGSIIWRPFLPVAITFALCSIVSFIHIQKYELRAVPLLPDDFLLADQAGDLTQFVDSGEVTSMIVGVTLLLIGAGVLDHCLRRIMGRNTKSLPWWDRFALIPRATFAMLSLAYLSVVAGPTIKQTGADWLEGTSFVAWNQNENYSNNGFIIGFFYNLGALEVKQPKDYNEPEMAEIAERYQEAQQAGNATRKKLSDVADNVVVILAETFYDPELLTEYYAHVGGDVVPNLHQIFKDYPSGYMYSPEYGGNTANIEFEVFTGLTNYYAQSFPYVNYVTKTGGLLSVAKWAKEYGFKTTAIHSFDGAMYKRNLVYPTIGFDDFIDDGSMKYTEHEYSSRYINDRSIYNEILDKIKNGDGQQMIGAVTMQNHLPYDSAQYPKLEFELRDGHSLALESSFQSLHESDKYLGEFLAELDKLDERTVVLWFGDHAAGILDAYAKSDDKTERDLSHLTPYFIYANFDIENLYTVKEVQELNAKSGFSFPSKIAGIDLPVVTPNCLQNMMYDVLNVEKPALFYLIGEVCEDNPILARAFLGDTPPADTQALLDYERAAYDMLAGKHYWDGN